MLVVVPYYPVQFEQGEADGDPSNAPNAGTSKRSKFLYYGTVGSTHGLETSAVRHKIVFRLVTIGLPVESEYGIHVFL